MKRIVVSVSILLIATSAFTQQYFFKNYNVKDGLLQSNVTCGLQSNNGYLYLGTEGGLSKFDGLEFKNYTKENNLAGSNITAIYQDNNELIWVGHQSGGISLIKRGIIQPFPDSLTNKTISCITEDQQGTIWISTLGDGAIALSKNGNKYTSTQFLGKEGLGDYIFQIYEDRDGKLWFVTDVGLKSKLKDKTDFTFERLKGMPPYQITSLIKDVDRNLWLGTYQGGVFKYNETTEKLTRFTTQNGLKSNWISHLNVTNDKSVWVSTWGGGITRIKGETVSSYDSYNGLQDNKIRFVFQDRENNIIIGTNEHGFSIFNNESFSLYNTKTNLTDNQIWSVHNFNNKTFIGHNKGVDILTNGKIEKIKNFNFSVRSICSINNNVFAATWGGGVYLLNSNTLNARPLEVLNKAISPNVNHLSVDEDGVLWVSTIKGLTSYDATSNNVKSFPGIIGKVEMDIACSFSHKGKLLLGTRKNGLILYNGNEFKRIANDKLLASPTSLTYNDKLNSFIVGTEGGGVFIISDNKVTSRIKRTNGLLSDFILGVESNANEIWISTNKGLNKYAIDAEKITSYDENDGYTPIEGKLNSIQIHQQKIYIGTVSGLVIYDPEKDFTNKRSPTLNLSGMKLNLKDTILPQNVNLSYKQNSLTFQFDAICLTNSHKLNYKVKLEGWDDWRLTSDKKISYTNLPEGQYTFMLIASNNDGVWNEKPLTFMFTIHPPFWRTWWFYILCTITAFTGIIVFIKLREKQLIKEKRVLEQKVQERTAEVVEKSNELEHALDHIQSSIVYAQRIQNAILPTDSQIKEHFPESFVFFKPRDIVSGDFYWMEKSGNEILFSAIDCTGHGVPGAFVSMVGNNILNQSVRKHKLTKPSEILDDVHAEVQRTLQQSDDSSVKDGMDLALCNYNTNTKLLQYAGAHNPMYLIRGEELQEFKANRFAIGYKGRHEGENFDNHEIKVEHGDAVYIFSDGFVDQFGGEKGRKYMSKRFKSLLIEIHKLPFDIQKEKIENELSSWMTGGYKQIDDILIWGVKF